MTAEIYTIKELAEMLKVSRLTIYRLIDRKAIGCLRVGGQIRFTQGQVDEYLNRVVIRVAEKREKRSKKQKPEVETANEVHDQLDQPSERCIKKGKPKTGGAQIWESYASAFHRRYGVDPPRNARQNALCNLLMQRLGLTDGIAVAAYYLTCQHSYYLTRGHALDALVKDCEKVRTEWATGNQMTASAAQEQDRIATQSATWTKVILKHADPEKKNDD